MPQWIYEIGFDMKKDDLKFEYRLKLKVLKALGILRNLVANDIQISIKKS